MHADHSMFSFAVIKAARGYMQYFRKLSKTFHVNTLGSLTCFTGCSFEHRKDQSEIKIIQITFLDKPIDRSHVVKCRLLRSTPTLDAGGRRNNREETGHSAKLLDV